MKYKTIVADPPWRYNNSENGAIIKTVKADGSIGKGVHVHDSYPSMSVSEICAMPINKFAEDNAHLYLWTTNTFMYDAHDVARAWGFIPKTIITWVKVHKEDSSRPSMKNGYYYRSASEHIIFAVRGSLPLIGTEVAPTAFMHTRLAHSVKPEYAFQMIEKQSPGPYLELFARRERSGWDVWGNEVESNIILNVPINLEEHLAYKGRKQFAKIFCSICGDVVVSGRSMHKDCEKEYK